MMQAQELLADITVLEVAVLKLKEKSTALQWQVGQERTEREIAQLRQGRSGTLMTLQPMIRHQDPGSSGFSPSFSSSSNLQHSTKNQLTDRQGCQAVELTLQQLQIIEKDYEDLKTKYSLSNGHHDDVQQHSIQEPSESFFTESSLLTSAVVAESCEDDLMLLSGVTPPALITQEAEPLHSQMLISPSSSLEQEKHIILPETTRLHVAPLCMNAVVWIEEKRGRVKLPFVVGRRI